VRIKRYGNVIFLESLHNYEHYWTVAKVSLGLLKKEETFRSILLLSTYFEENKNIEK